MPARRKQRKVRTKRAKRIQSASARQRGLRRKEHFEAGGTVEGWRGRHTVATDRRKEKSRRAARGKVRRRNPTGELQIEVQAPAKAVLRDIQKLLIEKYEVPKRTAQDVIAKMRKQRLIETLLIVAKVGPVPEEFADEARESRTFQKLNDPKERRRLLGSLTTGLSEEASRALYAAINELERGVGLGGTDFPQPLLSTQEGDYEDEDEEEYEPTDEELAAFEREEEEALVVPLSKRPPVKPKKKPPAKRAKEARPTEQGPGFLAPESEKKKKKKAKTLGRRDLYQKFMRIRRSPARAPGSLRDEYGSDILLYVLESGFTQVYIKGALTEEFIPDLTKEGKVRKTSAETAARYAHHWRGLDERGRVKSDAKDRRLRTRVVLAAEGTDKTRVLDESRSRPQRTEVATTPRPKLEALFGAEYRPRSNPRTHTLSSSIRPIDQLPKWRKKLQGRWKERFQRTLSTDENLQLNYPDLVKDQGHQAFEEGHPITLNPYAKGYSRRLEGLWNGGWKRGRLERRRADFDAKPWFKRALGERPNPRRRRNVSRRRNSRRYEYSEWLEFLSGSDKLSRRALGLKGKYEERIEELLDMAFEEDRGRLLDVYPDVQEVAYLSFASQAGHGVGLWEEREPWHADFERRVKRDRTLNKIYSDLEMEGYSNNPKRGKNAEVHHIDFAKVNRRWVAYIYIDPNTTISQQTVGSKKNVDKIIKTQLEPQGIPYTIEGMTERRKNGVMDIYPYGDLRRVGQRITQKADLKSQKYYTLWLQLGSGGFVVEKTYLGHYIRDALWDDIKEYNRNNKRQLVVFPQGVNPNR